MTVSHLVEDISDVSLRFSKPHSEQLGALDGDEVSLALIGDGLSQQSFTTTRRTVEQHSLGWGHTKLEVLVWMLDRVLYQLLKLTLDILQTSDIVPGYIWHLNAGLTESAWVALTKSPLKIVMVKDRIIFIYS